MSVPIEVEFSADLTALQPGQPFTLTRVANAVSVLVDLGEGVGPEDALPRFWGYSRPGNYRMTVIDVGDLARRIEIPVTVVAGEPALAATYARVVNSAEQFLALGPSDYPDNHLAIAACPDGSGDMYYWWGCLFADGIIGILRSRGTATDLLARGEIVRSRIVNDTISRPFPQAWFIPGPVHVVRRDGRPDLVVMAALLQETTPSFTIPVYGSVHFLVSDDYTNWSIVGEAWRHAVDKAAYLSGKLPADNYVGLNGGTALLWVADGSGVPNQGWLYLCLSQLNGPTHGPQGRASNLVPMSLARIWLPSFLAAVDAGRSPALLVAKWYQGGWDFYFDGPASTLPGAEFFGGLWANQIVRCPDLGLYVAIGQAPVGDGNIAWLSSAPAPEGPWSTPVEAGRFGARPSDAGNCYSFSTTDGTVGREFEVLAEVFDAKVNGPVRWEGLTLRVDAIT